MPLSQVRGKQAVVVAAGALRNLAAGAGAFAVAKIVETEGMWLPEADQTPEGIAANWPQISEGGERALQGGFEQSFKMVGQAASTLRWAREAIVIKEGEGTSLDQLMYLPGRIAILLNSSFLNLIVA